MTRTRRRRSRRTGRPPAPPRCGYAGRRGGPPALVPARPSLRGPPPAGDEGRAHPPMGSALPRSYPGSGTRNFLQRRPGQQQPLLPHPGEPDQGLGLVALARHLEHDALAPLAVDHVVAGGQPQALGAGGAYRRRGATPDRRFHDAVAAAPPDAATLALRLGAAPLGHHGERLGDLLEKATGRVVLSGAPQRAAPGVGEIEAL